MPSGVTQVQTVAPALFTANGNGQGVVAATAYKTIAPNMTPVIPVPVFQCGGAPGGCVSVPIALGVDTPLFVTFYASGIENRSGHAAVMVKIDGQTIAARSISSFQSSDMLAGVDEVTVGIPLALRGSGELDVVLIVDGQTSNAASINIQ